MECSVFNRRRVFSFAAASTPVAPRRPGAPGHGIANGLAPLLSSDHTGPANRECLQIRTSHGAPTSASIPPCNNPYGPGRGPSPIESTAFPYDEHTAKDTPPSRCLDGRRRSRRRPPPHARPMPSRAQEASPRFTTSVESSRSFGPPRLPANLRQTGNRSIALESTCPHRRGLFRKLSRRAASRLLRPAVTVHGRPHRSLYLAGA